jgi:hypothetical protein
MTNDPLARVTSEQPTPQEINAKRVADGVCRHCGGRIPCYSEYGDRAVGKRHTLASWRKARNCLTSWRKARNV